MAETESFSLLGMVDRNAAGVDFAQSATFLVGPGNLRGGAGR
jgi:hypothetical protein